MMARRSSLIFQNAVRLSLDAASAGIGTLRFFSGCRGFIGPVPLPLWIRVVAENTRGRMYRQPAAKKNNVSHGTLETPSA